MLLIQALEIVYRLSFCIIDDELDEDWDYAPVIVITSILLPAIVRHNSYL